MSEQSTIAGWCIVELLGRQPRIAGTTRELPRGTFYAEWWRYERQPDRTERSKRRSKIINRALAEKYRIALDYTGPITKTDAQKTLDVLIAEDTGVFIAQDRAATLADVPREYLTLTEPTWGTHTVRTSKNLIETHLIAGPLGARPITGIKTMDIQSFLNGYVSSGASKSTLSKLVLYLRAIFDRAVAKDIIVKNPARNPAQKLRARSQKRECRRNLSVEECQRLLSVLSGPIISSCG